MPLREGVDASLPNGPSPPIESASSPTSRAARLPAWLTVSQLCDRWQLGRKTVYKFIAANALPVWKVGRHLYRVAVADVLRFEIRNRLAARGRAPASRSRRRLV